MDPKAKPPNQDPRVESGRNQDIPLQPTQPLPPPPRPPKRCSRCNERVAKGRNLVVCFDGTSNKFGSKNTNVLELYSRIERIESQLVYYSSGIGTDPDPNPSITQRIRRALDLAFARTFDERVVKGYKWLADEFKDGDRIFIYGFSRGAYQARTLAAMIASVGLIPPRNDEQLPFVYQCYLDSEKKPNEAQRFKEKLSREAKVHFLGLWDTVSSIGFVREVRPGTNKLHKIVCYIRHALALDERRVKFLPEYICGGEFVPFEERTEGEHGIPRVKEVWFAGTHSDVGGGNVDNTELNNAAIPTLWMANQSILVGLSMTPSKVVWVDKKLREMRPQESLNGFYWLLELLPILRSTYAGSKQTTRWPPHFSQGRVIKDGQLLHISLCLMGKHYKPKAQGDGIMWSDIVAIAEGRENDMSWIPNGIKHLLEKDIYDAATIPSILENAISDPSNTEWVTRLEFMSSIRGGFRAILSQGAIAPILCKMIEDKVGHAPRILSKLIDHDTDRLMIRLPNLVETIHQVTCVNRDGEDDSMAQISKVLVKKYWELPLLVMNEYPSVAMDGGNKPQTKYLYQIAVAGLYFSRFLLSHDVQDLRETKQLLLGLPESLLKTADIRNCLATTLEAEGTVDALQKAVEIRIDLSDQFPDRPYHVDLANTSLNLATLKVHVQQGQTYEHLSNITILSRSIALTDKVEFAKCLSNLGNRLHDLDQQDDALEIAHRSVDLFREVFPYPGVDADMATALNNLSNRLSDAGRQDDALLRIREVVRMRRVLVARNATTAQSDLAVSLTNLSCRLYELENREGALATAQEAVDILRMLSRTAPRKYRDELASSLSAFSAAKLSLGRHNEALELAEEVVSLREALVREQPRPFNSDLARSLNDLCMCYSDLGHHEKALGAIERAVPLYEALARERPHSFNPGLALSLSNLSNCYSIFGQHEKALAAIERAVSLHDVLAQEQPRAFRADLAASLYNLSFRRSNLNRNADALEPAQRSLALYRGLAFAHPSVFKRDVVEGLQRLAECLSALECHDGAKEAQREADELRETIPESISFPGPS